MLSDMPPILDSRWEQSSVLIIAWAFVTLHGLPTLIGVSDFPVVLLLSGVRFACLPCSVETVAA